MRPIRPPPFPGCWAEASGAGLSCCAKAAAEPRVSPVAKRPLIAKRQSWFFMLFLLRFYFTCRNPHSSASLLRFASTRRLKTLAAWARERTANHTREVPRAGWRRQDTRRQRPPGTPAPQDNSIAEREVYLLGMGSPRA